MVGVPSPDQCRLSYTLLFDTISFDIPQTLTQVESAAIQGWNGLKLKMHLGLDSVGSFYS
ncbi:hypothetical protein [Nostoc sp.]|uniref:hypothetical protein n=1 Tax=Nostoc sp. TaxID=1180 RepID=UPI002FFB7FAB